MQTVEPLLGTRAEVDVSAASPAVALDAEHAVLREVDRLEKIFTTFDGSSELNEFRRTGSTRVSELIEVVELAAVWRERSKGAFDPGMQPLVDLWDGAERDDRLPSPEDLAAMVESRNHDTSGFDNLNAIAKGWIAQTALVGVVSGQPHVDGGWLSLGGDIVHRGTGAMTVGIEDPYRAYDNVAPMASIEISNEAVATSGGARRWWHIDGRRYPKVLDPRTGLPVDRLASATVVAPDAATADVLATIATVADTETILQLVEEAEAECLLVHRDRSRSCSSTRFRFG